MISNPLNPNPNIVTDVNHIDGIFRGIVEDNDDPLNLCRLRVRVPYLNGMPDSPDGIPTDGLPWAAACIPYGGPGYGQVLIPEVGSTVWVMFENQAKDRPVWIGCSYGAQSMTGKRDLKSAGLDTFVASDGEWVYEDVREDTPYTFKEHRKNSKVVIHTPKGFEISIDEADEHECLELIDRTGQLIRMYCPVTKEGNISNHARRTSGSVVNSDTNEGILEHAYDGGTPSSRNYILIESQSNDNNIQSSYLRLSKGSAILTDGEARIDQYGKNTTTDNGNVRSIYDGDNSTYVLTNYPGSVFHMSNNENAIAKGSSEVVVEDSDVYADNGTVAWRLKDAIEFHGPVRWGNGHYGGFSDDEWFRLYYPHIKLATGSASIILDGENVTISGKIRLASGNASITIDNDLKLSGETDITDDLASLTLRDGVVTIDSSSTKIASGESSIIVTDKDKLGDVEELDGDILISGDTKIATGENSLIVTDKEVDVSSNMTKVSNGKSSAIIHDNYIETNGLEVMQDSVDEEGHVIKNPDRISDVSLEDVSLEDVSMDVKIMDDVSKGDVSIDDYYYEGWYTGQHIDMLPVQ